MKNTNRMSRLTSLSEGLALHALPGSNADREQRPAALVAGLGVGELGDIVELRDVVVAIRAHFGGDGFFQLFHKISEYLTRRHGVVIVLVHTLIVADPSG